MDSSRNRAGSAMAFSVRARSVAASAVSGWRTSGTQHATSTRGSTAGLMKPSMPDVLTGVDVWFTMSGTLMFVYTRSTAMTTSDQEIREHVRDRYAAAALSVVSGSAASCCGPSDGPQTSCCGPSDALSAISDAAEGDIFGAALYTPGETDGLPEEAVLASLGCGNPLAVAELREGERVLALGSGGGIDVLLSARRVGPTGFAYGLDMTAQMLALAEENKRKSGISNGEFLRGQIENSPLPDNSVDGGICNCVINLSSDKDRVLREAFR